MNITGKGFKIQIETIQKDEIPKINKHFSFSHPSPYPHLNPYSIQGFDIQRYSLEENFKDLGIIDSFHHITNPVFEEDKIYLITFNEFVGEQMIFTPLNIPYELQCFYLHPFKILICTQLYKEVIPFDTNFTLCNVKQYLYFKKAGIFQKHKLFEEV